MKISLRKSNGKWYIFINNDFYAGAMSFKLANKTHDFLMVKYADI